jgi:hypothetical protein
MMKQLTKRERKRINTYSSFAEKGIRFLYNNPAIGPLEAKRLVRGILKRCETQERFNAMMSA